MTVEYASSAWVLLSLRVGVSRPFCGLKGSASKWIARTFGSRWP